MMVFSFLEGSGILIIVRTAFYSLAKNSYVVIMWSVRHLPTTRGRKWFASLYLRGRTPQHRLRSLTNSHFSANETGPEHEL